LDRSGGSVFRNLIRPAIPNEFAPPRQLNRWIASSKSMRPFWSILVVIVAVTLLSCVYRPSVLIKQGDPQQFIISAEGILDVFSVSGPIARCTAEWNQNRLPRMERYWEIRWWKITP